MQIHADSKGKVAVDDVKVIGTDTDLSATYDFLLVIHSNRGLISYPCRDKRRFSSTFPTAVYLTPLLREFPLEFCNVSMAFEKPESCPYHRQWKQFDECAFV